MHPSHHSLRNLHHISPRDLAFPHHLVDFGELLKVDSLERCFDQPTSEKLDRLCAVLSVAHIAALDANHLGHRFKDGCLDLGTGRETNDDDAASWSDVLGRLVEGLLTGGNDESAMRPETVFCRLADVCNDILGCSEVDEGL